VSGRLALDGRDAGIMRIKIETLANGFGTRLQTFLAIKKTGN
jgi:hypothetical protein